MIDDGPRFKQLLYRSVKRFDLDIAAWPWPPDAATEDWADYWECRFADVLFRVGLGVRKLIEAGKLSIEVQARPINAVFFPLLGDRYPNKINYPHLERFYDLSDGRHVQLPLIVLSNAIVHSFVLVPSFSLLGVEGLRLKEFFLASDRGRRKGVHLITWRDFVYDLVYPVASDDVISSFGLRLPNGESVDIPLSTYAIATEDRQRAIALYRSLSRGNDRAYDEFLAQWRAAYGEPGDEYL